MVKLSQRYVNFLLVIFLVLSSSLLASARVLQPRVDDQQGVQEVKVKDAENVEDNISNLMGLDENEACGNKEGEECTAERKLEEEIHLDYIYTQRHSRP